MKNVKKVYLSMILMLVSVNAISEPSVSELVYAELDQVEVGSNSLVVAGNTYSYKLDIESSSYKSKQDSEKSLSLRNLKPGNMYYFEMNFKGQMNRNSRFSDIIFISESEPSE